MSRYTNILFEYVRSEYQYPHDRVHYGGQSTKLLKKKDLQVAATTLSQESRLKPSIALIPYEKGAIFFACTLISYTVFTMFSAAV